MCGKYNFYYECSGEKIDKTLYKKAILDSNFSTNEINIIWDFYVTHSLHNTSSQSRSVVDYGWNQTTNSTNGYLAIEKLICAAAHISEFAFIRAKECNHTLKNMDLYDNFICTKHPRAVMLQNFKIQIDENEECKITSNENKLECLMRHIRNSLAHGNTYFFENGNILLEDIDNKKITAEILLEHNTLIEWIKIIDKEGKFYNF